MAYTVQYLKFEKGNQVEPNTVGKFGPWGWNEAGGWLRIP